MDSSRGPNRAGKSSSATTVNLNARLVYITRSRDESTATEGRGCGRVCGDGARDAARGPAALTLAAIAAEAGVTAGALVQRFGSKRELVLAHWRRAPAGSGDLNPAGRAHTFAPQRVRAAAAMFARLAVSPPAALRNLAYMQNDWADPVLRRHVLRHARAARARYEQLLAEAVSRGELRADTDVQTLARMIEVTLGGRSCRGRCFGRPPPRHVFVRISTPRSGRIWRGAKGGR